MAPKTASATKVEANKVLTLTTFALSQSQEQSRLLKLPNELRDKILCEVLVDDPQHLPDLSLAFACKQLYNEATSLISCEFAIVNVAVQCYDRLGRVLKQKVKTAIHRAIIEDPGDGSTRLPESCWMNLLISKDGPFPFPVRTHLFMLIGLANLRAFLKALVLVEGVDLPHDPDFDPDVRFLGYELEFPAKKHNNAQEKLKHTLREKQLLQPFFDFFWSGFKNFSLKHAVDEEVAQTLVTHVAKDKWKSPEDLIAHLNQGREEGKAAYLKKDYITAHKIWQEALDVLQNTGHSTQGYNFSVNRQGTAYGAKLDEVTFFLWSNLSAVLLKFSQQPRKTHKEKMELAGDAHQACVFAIDFSQMCNFQPTNQQLGKVHFRKAQALRLRGCLRGNLKAAERSLAQAMKFCPKDPAMKLEAKEIEKTMLSEMAQGNFKASLEKEHGSGCHCGC